jgi:hypothetical protein
MSVFKEEITLVNLRDAGNAQSGFIPESEVRQLTVNAVVDTGAWTGTCGPLVINEETRAKLGLRVEEAGETAVDVMVHPKKQELVGAHGDKGNARVSVTFWIESREQGAEQGGWAGSRAAIEARLSVTCYLLSTNCSPGCGSGFEDYRV